MFDKPTYYAYPLQWDSLFYYMPPSVNTNDDIKLAPAPTPVPAAWAAGMQKKLSSIISSALPPKRKSVSRTRTGFLLHFLRRHDKLPFAVCIYTCEEMRDCKGRSRLSARSALQSVSRFEVSTGDPRPFAAGFPIGARAALLAHDFASQSLVCYTFASG